MIDPWVNPSILYANGMAAEKLAIDAGMAPWWCKVPVFMPYLGA